MKRGKEVECKGTDLQNGEEIGQIVEEGYKYLGVLEKVDIYVRKRWKKTSGKNTLRGWEQRWNQNNQN